MNVTKETKLGELAENYPAVVEVLVKHGMLCVGCGMARFETLEQGARSHGFSDGEIEKLVEEINTSSKLGVTVAAIFKLHTEAANRCRQNCNVRLYYADGFEMKFEEKPAPSDAVVDAQGLKIFYDKSLEEKLDSAIIDVRDGQIVIRKPVAKKE